MNQPTGTLQVTDVDAVAKIAENIKLPPLPSVITSINRELQKDNPELSRLAENVSKDPALSAKVLKVINSPFYGLAGKVTSVDQAIFYMGATSFYMAVVVSALKDALEIDNKTEDLWLHSQIVAQLCKYIANMTGQITSEWAYMAGLFHDAGLPLLVRKDNNYAQVMEMVIATGGDIHTFEQQNFNTSHAVLGYMLAQSWGQPGPVCEAIQFHHIDDLNLYEEGPAKSLAAVLMLADHVARVASQYDNNNLPREPSPQISQYLNLDQGDIDEIYSAADEISRSV